MVRNSGKKPPLEAISSLYTIISVTHILTATGSTRYSSELLHRHEYQFHYDLFIVHSGKELKAPTSACTYFVRRQINLDINCSLRITNYNKSDSLGSQRQNTLVNMLVH